MNELYIDFVLLQDTYCIRVGKLKGFRINWTVFLSKIKSAYLVVRNGQVVNLYLFTGDNCAFSTVTEKKEIFL